MTNIRYGGWLFVREKHLCSSYYSFTSCSDAADADAAAPSINSNNEVQAQFKLVEFVFCYRTDGNLRLSTDSMSTALQSQVLQPTCYFMAVGEPDYALRGI